MFYPGSVIRHPNCLDIDVLVLKVTYSGTDYVKLKVLYLNRNYHNAIIDPRPDKVRIKRTDLTSWALIR